ncbi:glycosyltransferase family 2 protein [Rhodobacter maris]|uniref:Cellulose synthase/poly-beta-1,6-N-acetylglucosamine synthase-like glycosyltransferase n=1 Tax=Rhodobacter maris TaxID=446682 RepID=A0A285SAY9_9RHOB|nr:glycosyltransferase family 2 protein [Rhodobacter maris]SOC04810.1 cellulose synthase/poly-beta-1,6-N-acetylglucosamine synthase-like glycosyltransferase [Rhodobacter maris]
MRDAAERKVIHADFGAARRAQAAKLARPMLAAEASPSSPPPQTAPSQTAPSQTATAAAAPRPQPGRKPLGQILLEMEAVAPGDLLKAVTLRARQQVRLGDILLAHDWVSEADLMAALARQWKAAVVDLIAEPPDPRLIDRLGAEACLTGALLPWRRVGGLTLIATARPDDFARARAFLPPGFEPCRMVLAPERDIHTALLCRRQTALIRRAEIRVDPAQSCRTRNERRAAWLALGAVLGLGLGLALAPVAVFGLLFFWAIVTLFATMGLKIAAAVAEYLALRHRAPPRALCASLRGPQAALPMISILVPLFQERDIAARLIERLGRLHYPRELLDILLVVEEADTTTRDALATTTLPHWMRVVSVPGGPIRTKPRALNYALNFCRGTIVGVYDAEDRPDPDQLHVVARRFAESPPEVACLQGILDYYNPRTNWLARCFTIEYAVWFRAVLPGLARLGLVVPLGGTTLFFRREALENLGGWDAHNVTEDADLGLRLARFGYRTELIATVTGEEANCRALPWVKQRSRWLKGYAMTWAVHMRAPRRLWRDLGPWRFLGVQVLILGTLSQYLLAPVLWSCWAILFGFWHPVAALLSPQLETLLLLSFVMAELVNIAVGAWAVRGPTHRHLIPWVPSLHVYFPLGALAGWKAIYEVITKPFYWDKTAHGLFDRVPGRPHRSHSVLVARIAAAARRSPAPARTALAPQID